MQLMLLDVLRMGALQLLWDFSNWPLSLLAWTTIGFGVFLQLFLLKKGRAKVFVGLLLIGVLWAELLCNAITGIIQLLPLLFYMLILYLLIGSAVAAVIHFLKKRI